MQDPVENTDFLKSGHVDVILDYVYGPITVQLLGSLKTMQPIQFVQAGTLSAQVMELKGAILRGMNLTIRGSGPGSWNMEDLRAELPLVAQATKALRALDVKVAKLSDVESAWDEKTNERLVFVP